MQLIIAAPENISPEKGTTYKLVRKVFNNQEHVHVVGLRGFGQPEPTPAPEALPEPVTEEEDDGEEEQGLISPSGLFFEADEHIAVLIRGRDKAG